MAILDQNIRLSICLLLFRGVAIGRRYIGYAQEIMQIHALTNVCARERLCMKSNIATADYKP